LLAAERAAVGCAQLGVKVRTTGVAALGLFAALGFSKVVSLWCAPLSAARTRAQ
jgi:hypothetical protein